MSWSALVPDVTPLRGPGAAGFRAMFTSRTVAWLGAQAAEVALLVQAQRITGSPLVVGTLGLAELVPLVVFNNTPAAGEASVTMRIADGPP